MGAAIADNDGSAADADAHFEGWEVGIDGLLFGDELGEGLLGGECGEACAAGMVGQVYWCAEESEYSVAFEFVDGGVVLIEDFGHAVEVDIEDANGFFWSEVFAGGGEAGEVGEVACDFAEFSGESETFGAGYDFIDDAGRDVLFESSGDTTTVATFGDLAIEGYGGEGSEYGGDGRDDGVPIVQHAEYDDEVYDDGYGCEDD